jgi:hypothetical protein
MGTSAGGSQQPEEFHLVGTIPDILLLDFNLTADQRARITALRDNLLQELGPLQEKMNFEQERQKRQYGTYPNRDPAGRQAPSGTYQLLQGMVNDKRTRYLQALVQILTSEQLVMLNRALRGSGGTAPRQGQDADRERGGPGGGMGGPGGGGMGGPGGGRSGGW